MRLVEDVDLLVLVDDEVAQELGIAVVDRVRRARRSVVSALFDPLPCGEARSTRRTTMPTSNSRPATARIVARAIATVRALVAAAHTRSIAMVYMLTCAAHAPAQDAPVPTQLDPVVVTAARSPQRFDQLLADVTVIGPEEIARAGAQKLWAGTVTIKPDAKTGAHHHGHLESIIYVVKGKARMRWGECLQFTAEANPGDFIFVPPYVPHQEINASRDEVLECVLVRSDGEAVAINLDIEPVEKPETVLWVDPVHRDPAEKK